MCIELSYPSASGEAARHELRQTNCIRVIRVIAELPTLAGMAGVGELHRLFRTFLNLKTTCKKASLSLNSDGRNCHVTLSDGSWKWLPDS